MKRDQLPEPGGGINLLWEGTLFGSGSFARMNQEICNGLSKIESIDLTSLPYELGRASEGYGRYPELEKIDLRNKGLILSRLRKLPSICVRARWPVQENPPLRGLKWVIFIPWEYSALPHSLAKVLNQADAVWTTSQFCFDSFVRSGVDPKKITTIHLGVDSELFHPVGNTFPLNTSKSCKMLFVGGTIFRKGIDVLLKSYRKAFNAGDDICLVIKDFGNETIYRGQTNEALIRAFRANPLNPEILYIDSNLSDSEIAGLYRSCDLLVSSYRGEGFNLPVLEAMATGLPVTVTKGGSTDDFCDKEVSWKINSSKKSVGNQIYGMETPVEAWLLEPSEEHLTNLLREAFLSPELRRRKGIKARKRAENLTWGDTIKLVLNQMEELCNISL